MRTSIAFIQAQCLSFFYHPLFFALIAYIAGIALCAYSVYVCCACILASVLYTTASWWYYAQPWRLLSLFLASAALGALLTYYQRFAYEHFKTATNQKTCTVVGTVIDYQVDLSARFKHCVTIRLADINEQPQANHGDMCGTSLSHLTAWYAPCRTIQLYTARNPHVAVADQVAVNNLFFKNNASASFQDYLIKEGVCATLFDASCNITVLKTPYVSFRRYLHNLRASLFYAVAKKCSASTFALYSSLFLGNKAAVKKNLRTTKDTFALWGLSHYLARSGLHLVIFIMIWSFLLTYIPAPFVIKQLFSLLLIVLYYLLSWSSIPFTRALLVFMACRISVLLSLPVNLFHILSLACFAVLIYNPMQLFFLDFQLSFGLTFALCWINLLTTQRKIFYMPSVAK